MIERDLSDTAKSAMRALARALRLKDDALVLDPAGSRLAALVRRRDGFGIAPEDPVREIKSRIGDRWSSLILSSLDAGMMGHSQLRRVVSALSFEGRISQRMLTLSLRALERDGLVERVITPSVPPRVDYRLTPLGRGLHDQMMALISWIESHHAEVLAARDRFEAAEAKGGAGWPGPGR